MFYVALAFILALPNTINGQEITGHKNKFPKE